MTSTESPLEQLRAQLVDGIPRFERRRRRRRVAGVGVALASVAGLVMVSVAVARGDNAEDVATDVVIDEGLFGEPPPGVAVDRLSRGGIPAVLVATSGNAFGLAVADLDGGYRATYPDGVHAAGEGGALSGAVVTAADRLVLWRSDQPALAYPADRDADGRHELVDGGLAEPGVEVGTILGERTIMPTERGDAAWILAAGDASDKRLELVDLATGEVRVATTVPPGSRLVDAVGDDAVIHPAFVGATDRVLAVSPTGDTRDIAAPEPARLAGLTEDSVVWIAGGDPDSVVGDRLIVATDSGTTTVDLPGQGGWVRAGAPTVPSNSPPLRTMTADGTRLLLALTDPTNPNSVADRVVVVDLERSGARVVYEGAGASSAFWAGDDKTALVVEGTDDGQVVTAVDTSTDRAITIDDVVPSGFRIVAGG
jgi:hypothetical protein